MLPDPYPRAMRGATALALSIVLAGCGGTATETTTAATTSATTAAPTTAASATTTTPAAQPERSDVPYSVAATPEGSAQTLDIYGSAPGAPVVLILHGGGADKDHPDVVAVAGGLQAEGFTVVVPTVVRNATPPGVIAAGGRMLRESMEQIGCALRMAADETGAGEVTVLGHSAGGFFGVLATLAGTDDLSRWDAYGTGEQITCSSETAPAGIGAFVSYNGAWFIFQRSSLPDDDPELWALANPREFATSGAPPIRAILGADDAQTPAWHLDEVEAFVGELADAGVDAETTRVPGGGHGLDDEGPMWDALLSATLEVTPGA